MTRHNGTENYGQCTDLTRKQLIGFGWKYDKSIFLWRDPQSHRYFSEPEATVIMKSRLRAIQHPEDRIEPYMKKHGRKNEH